MRGAVPGVLIAVLVVLLPAAADAAVNTQLVGNFDTPIQLFAPQSVPGSTLYVVEKGGKIMRRQSGGHRNVVLDIHGQVSTGGEQGLLSALISGRKLFVYYTNKSWDSRVVRYRLNSGLGRVQDGSRKTILRAHQPADNHNGGTLQYRRGHLYLSLGDGGGGCDTYHNAQDMSSKLGKLLRHDSNGWKIVGYGLRNPWRWSFDRLTGAIYIGDVGQSAREEVDFLPASKVGLPAENYGWNRYEGDLRGTCSNPDRWNNSGQLIFPKYDYGRSVGSTVIGGFVYRGSEMPAQQGRYFFGDIGAGGWIKTADAKTLRNRQTLGVTVPGLYSFGENSEGELFVISGGGQVSKLVDN